jgi:hypothetical protein
MRLVADDSAAPQVQGKSDMYLCMVSYVPVTRPTIEHLGPYQAHTCQRRICQLEGCCCHDWKQRNDLIVKLNLMLL